MITSLTLIAKLNLSYKKLVFGFALKLWGLTIVLALATTEASPQHYHFKNISTEDGLSHNFVSAIYQDKEGFMWFGSLAGIDRYDGLYMKQFPRNENSPKAIKGDLVSFFYEDKTIGGFWFGTEKGGLHLYDKKNQTFTHFPNPLSRQSQKYSAYDLSETPQGTFLLGTDIGLLCFDPRTRNFVNQGTNNSLAELTGETVFSVIICKNGHTWAGTSNGLFRKVRGGNSFVYVDIPWKFPANKEVTDIVETPMGDLLIGTFANGLLRLDPKNLTCKILLPDQHKPFSFTTRQLTPDNEGNYWIATRNGIYIYYTQSEMFKNIANTPGINTSLAHNSVLACFKDRNGDFWLGTRLGVSYWATQKKAFKYFPAALNIDECLNSPSVFAFLPYKNQLWIGTESGGVNIMDTATYRFSYLSETTSPPKQLTSNNIKALAVDDLQHIWIGTFMGGLNVYSPSEGTIKHFEKHTNHKEKKSLPDNRVNCMIYDHLSQLWIGTNGGLTRYNPKQNTFDDFYTHLSTRPIIWLYQDLSKHLWAATADTIFRVDAKSGLLQRTIPTDVVTRTLLQDKKGNYWVTTVGKGLARIDTVKWDFSYIDMSWGLSSNLTFGILEDDEGDLWISTANGLNRYSPTNQRVTIYSKNDGPQIDQYNYNSFLRLPNGNMLFGGLNGFVLFNPAMVKSNPYAPLVAFTDFRYRQGTQRGARTQTPLAYDINYCDTVKLKYNQNFFTIRFAALDYSNPPRNQLMYKMDGIDQEWVMANDRRAANYTQMPAGTYRFRLKGSNNNGVWNENEKQVVIIITPPIWLTWWFKSAMVITAIILIILVYRWKTKAEHRIKKILHQMVDEKTRDLEQSTQEIQQKNLILTELTEKVNQQNKLLAKQAEELEKKVAERTHQLEQAKSKAEESDRLKTAFLANMSHEIRTPLNGILGFADLLKDEEITRDEHLSFVTTIEQSGQRMLHIINDLIDISKIEANQMALRHSEIDIHELLGELHTFFTPEAHKKRLRFEWIRPIPAHPLRITTDRDKLAQVLTNLLNNAIKYTHQGQVEIICIPNHTHVTFVVSDTGIGIPERIQPQLFQRFVQGDSSMSKRYEGAGLGLYITKNLVEMMSGRIWFESASGAGSRFYVEMPLGVSEL